MCPAEIDVSFEDGRTKEPLRVPDGVLAEALTPVGRVLVYVVPRAESAGSLYERTGFLFPGQKVNSGEDIVGEGLFFGGDTSALWVLLHRNEWKRRTQESKVVLCRSYDTPEGKLTVTLTTTEEVKGKKAPSSRELPVTPVLRLAPV